MSVELAGKLPVTLVIGLSSHGSRGSLALHCLIGKCMKMGHCQLRPWKIAIGLSHADLSRIPRLGTDSNALDKAGDE